jgi:hypothetical protein
MDQCNDLKIMKANSVNQKYMTELISNQKMSPNKKSKDHHQNMEAAFIRNQLINSEEERLHTRRILSELGTCQLSSQN